MRRFQFSLRALLGSAVFVAVACPSLLYASETIASLVFTATAVLLLAAVVAALFRRGPARAFWVGFAIFGWGYLWLAYRPDNPFALPVPAYGDLATTRLMSFTYYALLPRVRTRPAPPPQPYGAYAAPSPDGYSPGYYDDDPFGAPGDPEGPGYPGGIPIPASYPPTNSPPASSYPDYFDFIRVGHSLWAWLFAVFGGLVARYFYVTREKQP